MNHEISRRDWIAGSLLVPAVLANGCRLASQASAPKPAWQAAVRLGNAGLSVTPLGLGCEYTKDSDLIRQAADAGITYFNSFPDRGDTSNFPVVGKALKPMRDRVILAGGSNNRTSAGLQADLELQLKAFGTDRIDLFYLLALGKPEALTDEMIAFLESARKAGKIQAGALSTHGLTAIAPRLFQVAGTIRALMITCNFAAWTSQSWADGLDILGRLRAAGMGIVAMKSLMGGMASAPANHAALAEALKTEAGRRHGLAAALRWALAHPLVDTVPVGMRNQAELSFHLQAAAEAFTDSDHRLLAIAVQDISPDYCRVCRQCDNACRCGLPIPEVLRCLMYAESYHDRARARHAFAELHPSVREANCGGCSGCTVRCPNGVRVREQVQRALSELA